MTTRSMKPRWPNLTLILGILLVGLHVAVGLLTLVWLPYDPAAMTGGRLAPPSWEHWAGTDRLGRDFFTQMTLVFVSHDLGAVAALCDDLVILEKGHLVEAGPTRKILADPQHSYTRMLLESVPRMPA